MDFSDHEQHSAHQAAMNTHDDHMRMHVNHLNSGPPRLNRSHTWSSSFSSTTPYRNDGGGLDIDMNHGPPPSAVFGAMTVLWGVGFLATGAGAFALAPIAMGGALTLIVHKAHGGVRKRVLEFGAVSSPLKAGWLHKQAVSAATWAKNWKMRHITLGAHRIEWRKEEGGPPLGYLPIKATTSVAAKDNEKRLSVKTGDNELVLECIDATAAQAWVAAIDAAIRDAALSGVSESSGVADGRLPVAQGVPVVAQGVPVVAQGVPVQ